jgi:hypothetical protein
MRRVVPALALVLTVASASGCRDLSGFSSGSGSYAGPVVQASFVLAGMDPSTNLCVTLDTDHLQDGPGALSTSDGRFGTVPLRPIPQLWQDPLSTFTFGEGRLKNLMYVATASTPFSDGNGNDVFVVVSLMQSGGVEVRLIRGAPGLIVDGGSTPTGGNLFAVFDLTRQSGPCSY